MTICYCIYTYPAAIDSHNENTLSLRSVCILRSRVTPTHSLRLCTIDVIAVVKLVMADAFLFFVFCFLFDCDPSDAFRPACDLSLSEGGESMKKETVVVSLVILIPISKRRTQDSGNVWQSRLATVCSLTGGGGPESKPGSGGSRGRPPVLQTPDACTTCVQISYPSLPPSLPIPR